MTLEWPPGNVRREQLKQIRYRAGMPGGNIGSAAADRAWLLGEVRRLQHELHVLRDRHALTD